MADVKHNDHMPPNEVVYEQSNVAFWEILPVSATGQPSRYEAKAREAESIIIKYEYGVRYNAYHLLCSHKLPVAATLY